MSGRDAGAARGEGEVVAAGARGALGHALACLALVALTVALYAPTLGTGWFEIDDALYVPENPNLARLDAASLGRLLSEPYFGNYSPAHLLSYALDRALGGLDPFVFHLSNALWAGACAAVTYLLALRLAGTARAGLVAGVLFALHPAHVEAVAWISSRKDLVAAAFAVPSALAWLRWRERGSWAAYGLSLALFVVATAGKLSVVVLPAVLLAFDLVLERRALLPSLADKLPHAGAVAFFALRVASAQPETNVAVGVGDVVQIGGLFVQLLAGLGDFVIFRPVPEPAADPMSALARGALFVAFAVGPWLSLPRALRDAAGGLRPETYAARPLAVALCLHAWVVLALVPSQVLGFVYPVSDRYLFFPSVALCVLVGLSLERTLRSRSAIERALGLVGIVALAGVWGWKSWSGVRAWADPRSVFHAQAQAVSDVNSHEYLALHYLRAVDGLLDAARNEKGELPAGTAELAGALGFDRGALEREWAAPVPRRPATDALIRRLVELSWRELEEAAALPTERSLPSLYYRRGRVLDLRGEPAAALEEFRRAEREARIHPIQDVADAYLVQSLYSQGLMSERLGDVQAALRAMRRAVEADPTFADVRAQVQRLAARVEEEGR